MADAPPNAVFLSYASQDAAAVERIADALRAAGVEVWFDRNELVGGDAWDRKIRQQIRECALFVPVISAATQARGEGYFRLEWKLAVDRSHLMAPDQPFLLPVVIDDTPDAAARVADEFRAVQWTRLPGGETPEKFCARVKKLLGGVSSPTVGGALRPDESNRPGDSRPKSTPSTNRRTWLVPTVLASAVIVALALWLPWSGQRPAAHGPQEKKEIQPVSAARKLLAEARKILDEGDELQQESYTMAEELLRKAAELDRTDGEIWAAWSQLSSELFRFSIDRTPARREALRSQTERASRLAPDSVEVQVAIGNAADYLGLDQSATEETLRAVAKRAPENPRVLTALGRKFGRAGKVDEAVEVLARAAALAGSNPLPLTESAAILLSTGRYSEAEAMIAKALARRPSMRASIFDTLQRLGWHGDPKGAAASLQRWPPWFMLEDRAASAAGLVWLWNRQPEKALAIYQRLPRDYLRTVYFTGPRAALTALAHAQAGHAAAARDDWRLALQVAERELAATPDDYHALYWKAWALSQVGDRAAAEAIRQSLEQRDWAPPTFFSPEAKWAGLLLTLGHAEEAINFLQTTLNRERQDSRVNFKNQMVSSRLTRAVLELNPLFDPVRTNDRFRRLLADAPSPSLTPAATPAVSEKSLVVLPLENLSPDPENAFFTDGMHFEITTTVSRISELKVISRDSALALKGLAGSLGEKAEKVGVANVLTGSVRRAGTNVRISLELRRARDEALLWSQTYNKELGAGVLAIQADIAEQVARVLQARNAKGSWAGAKFMTSNSEAYDRLMKVLRALDTDYARVQGAESTISELTAILQLDPNFMTAASMLAINHARAYQNSTDPAERARHAAEAKRWAETASRLAPGGAGDDALANYYFRVEPNYPRVLEFANNLIQAMPNEATGHNRAGLALSSLGRHAEALAAYERAIELDPLNAAFRSNAISALVRLRRRSEAEVAIERFVSLKPNQNASAQLLAARFALDGTLPDDVAAAGEVWLRRARRFPDLVAAAERELAKSNLTDLDQLHWLDVQSDALHYLNRPEEAKAAAHKLLTLAHQLRSTDSNELRQIARYRAWALARLDRTEEAASAGKRVVESIPNTEQFREHQYAEVNLAELYAFLNRPRECVELLAKLLRVPSGLTVPMLKVEPTWDNVREDPGFQALLADPKNSAPL